MVIPDWNEMSLARGFDSRLIDVLKLIISSVTLLIICYYYLKLGS